jgi:hypothetical protein
MNTLMKAAKEYEALCEVAEAAKLAQAGGKYIIDLCEADLKAGESANPFERSMPETTIAHCYAATNFMNTLNQALRKLEMVRR